LTGARRNHPLEHGWEETSRRRVGDPSPERRIGVFEKKKNSAGRGHSGKKFTREKKAPGTLEGV